MSASPFANLPVIGDLPRAAAASKLREIGEDEAAEKLERAAPPPAKMSATDWWPFGDKAWQHTAHSIGFLPANGGGAGPRKILGVGEAQADASLKNARVNVALNTLRVADYPGGGTHRVLFDFYARNQVPGASEDLHFNAAYRAREGERAAVRGYPIFVGLGVGAVGVAFQFHTVNVKNDDDEAFLDFLEGDAFKSGLKLATTAQPAIAPLSGMALALTKSIAQRNSNVSVQDCYLGLDFAGTAMGARLAIGDYIAVQVPEKLQRIWDWQDWVYEPSAGLIVSREDPASLIPYNYVVFGVSRYEGE
jgi:hypothetical protein